MVLPKFDKILHKIMHKINLKPDILLQACLKPLQSSLLNYN